MHIPMLNDAGPIQSINVYYGPGRDARLRSMDVKDDVVGQWEHSRNVVNETNSLKISLEIALCNLFSRWDIRIVLNVRFGGVIDISVDVSICVGLDPFSGRFSLFSEKSLGRLGNRKREVWKKLARQSRDERWEDEDHETADVPCVLHVWKKHAGDNILQVLVRKEAID